MENGIDTIKAKRDKYYSIRERSRVLRSIALAAFSTTAASAFLVTTKLVLKTQLLSNKK